MTNLRFTIVLLIAALICASISVWLGEAKISLANQPCTEGTITALFTPCRK